MAKEAPSIRSASSDDNLTCDRLVDGELSADERRELLASLDQREEGWRRCALAFLEAHQWDSQFEQILADPETLQPTPATHAVRPVSVTRAGAWLAIAAGLLVAFVVGRSTQSPRLGNRAGSELATNNRQEVTDRQDAAPADEIRIEPLSPEDVVTLLVRDAYGKSQRLQIPLMEAETDDRHFGVALPPALREKFQDRGLDVQRRRRYAPLFFERDEQLVPMVVPVDDTYVVPVNRPVF